MSRNRELKAKKTGECSFHLFYMERTQISTQQTKTWICREFSEKLAKSCSALVHGNTDLVAMLVVV